jgi:preprotein translocase subunit SecG
VIYVLYTIHVLVCVFLILVVLLQQGKGADLSVFGGGSTQTAFGSRGATTFLHKLTVASFVIFVLTTLAIGIPQFGGSGSVLRGAAGGKGAAGARKTPATAPGRQAPGAPGAAPKAVPAGPAGVPAAPAGQGKVPAPAAPAGQGGAPPPPKAPAPAAPGAPAGGAPPPKAPGSSR